MAAKSLFAALLSDQKGSLSKTGGFPRDQYRKDQGIFHIELDACKQMHLRGFESLKSVLFFLANDQF